MKLFSLAVLAFLLLPTHALALQLACGEYELVGEYRPASSQFILSPGTEGELPLFLVGPQAVGGFLPEPGNHYRIGVRVERKVGDEGGVVRLLDIKGMELPSRNALPILSGKPGACR